ncbi:MAG: oligosaccharide flippase family protein [Pseudomonadota bacterium]|nr:oligosaccharide flippase family protein [Pseudomonadota bacterium]
MAINLFATDRKFFQDAMWNYSAFAIMALTGVILNFFIAWKMGLEALGIFNQIYAIYVVLGQLAAFGLHDSVQKHIAEYANDKLTSDLVGRTAFWIAFGTGCLIGGLLFTLSGVVEIITNSVHVGKGVAIVAPAICLFSVNKILMGILNGARRMKAFAIVQSIRVVVILCVCFGIALSAHAAYLLALGFLCAEIAITPVLLILTRAWSWPFGITKAKKWATTHIKFGVKALSGGFLSESYIRIDILMLAIFVSDLNVGIYSFAALFVEGLFQVPVVIRTISNPVLVKILLVKDPTSIVKFVRKVSPISAVIYILIAAVVLIGFPFLSNIYPTNLIISAHELLFILLAGLLLYAIFIPFDYVLLQSGMPGRQSLLFTVNVITNILLNVILIPFYGILGAALATAISFVLSAVFLNIAARMWLGCRNGLMFMP